MLLTLARLLRGAASIAVFACGLAATPAAALDAREVEAVVAILERLSSETEKTVFYDEEAAQEWFEIDDEASQIIPAAGFTDASWKEAFDGTMTGFIASIPEAELEAMMEEFVNGIAEAAKMTPQQKEEARKMLHAELGRFEEIRALGAQYRGVVAPYAPRLRKLSLPK